MKSAQEVPKKKEFKKQGYELKDENTTGKEFAPRCIVCYGAKIHHK
jgi:hypothetical protein